MQKVLLSGLLRASEHQRVCIRLLPWSSLLTPGIVVSILRRRVFLASPTDNILEISSSKPGMANSGAYKDQEINNDPKPCLVPIGYQALSGELYTYPFP